MEEGRLATDTAIHFLYILANIYRYKEPAFQEFNWDALQRSRAPTFADCITQRCHFKRLPTKKQLCERQRDHMGVLQRASPSLQSIYLSFSPYIYTYIHIHTHRWIDINTCAHKRKHTYIYIYFYIYIYISFPVLGVVTTTLVYKAS